MIVFIILTIFFLFINRRLMKKEKYYVPIIIFVLSIIIVGISAFQIVTRENKEHYEIQTMDNNIVINNSNEYTDVKDTVITDKSYFELDLLRDFAIMNISTVLCIGDIIWNKKRKEDN